MEYSSLTKDQQRQILNGRIAGWEADHFGHEINLLALEANSASEEELKSTRDALTTLENSVLAARAELNALGTANDNPTES